MEIDFESAVESVNVSASKAIKTVLEAVVNSIQSCRYDDSKHIITVKIHTNQLNTDGNKSEIVEGFDIIDDGEGFTDKNYKSFCTLYIKAKKQSFGCKGVGRLTWLKVFKDVSVEGVYSVGDSFYERKFFFGLKFNGVKGGEEPMLLEGIHSNRTVIKLRYNSKDTYYHLRRTQAVRTKVFNLISCIDDWERETNTAHRLSRVAYSDVFSVRACSLHVDEVEVMCTVNEGMNMRIVFNKYMKGKPVSKEDVPALKSLSRASYIEFYMDKGVLCARPGPIGSMIKSVKTDH